MTVYSDLRVVDLADGEFGLTGQILADLGADVVRVGVEGSTTGSEAWAARAYRRGKRTVIAGRDALRSLLAGADVLIEAADADGAWMFDPAVIARDFPSLVHVTLSWFGRSGPKAELAATDLIATAASGFLFVTGTPGSAPLRISAPQAALHAAADAAVGALIAVAGRRKSGCGEHVDAAAQESMTLALLGRSLDAAVGQPRAERTAGSTSIGKLTVRYLFQARDGCVIVQPAILPPLAAFGRRYTEWLIAEGMLDARFADWDWGTTAMRMLGDRVDGDDWRAIEEGTAALFARLTKRQIMDEAVRRKLLVAPVFDVQDLLSSPHFEAREFVCHDGEMHHAGPFARFSRFDLAHERRARVSIEALVQTWQPRSTVAASEPEAPLAGVKIVDLFWVVAGPGATRMLADYGAIVVHVESRKRVDMARSVPPYIDAIVDPERAALFHTTNANKLALSLDLSTVEGRAVLRDLIEWADVLTESFSPGVLERMGFGYEAVKRLNPRIIMISSCLMGQTGPWRDYAGFGNLAAAVTGFHQLTGRSGEPPTGCYGPYTDFIGVRYNAVAILAALDHRQRTGAGQYIDMAQAEAALHYLAGPALEYWETGVAAAARGNRDVDMVPHGVYACAGVDQWVAIAIRNDRDWRALCDAARLVEWAGENAAQRRRHEDEIDVRIEHWTRTLDADAATLELQRRGVPAHPVVDTATLVGDAQLAHRRHFHRIEHGIHGHTTIESSRLVMSRTQPSMAQNALTFGRDNAYVLGPLLGYSADQIAALERAGALQ